MRWRLPPQRSSMKRFVTRRKRWHGAFRSLRSADLLWVYAGTSAGQGAVWHRHHGDNRPHLHVHLNVPEQHSDQVAAHGHDHDKHHHSQAHEHSHEMPHHHRPLAGQHGHWHHLIPVAGVAHQLLIIGLCEVWFATPDAAIAVIPGGSAVSARAPPVVSSFT
jgi:hypothetical protein